MNKVDNSLIINNGKREKQREKTAPLLAPKIGWSKREKQYRRKSSPTQPCTTTFAQARLHTYAKAFLHKSTLALNPQYLLTARPRRRPIPSHSPFIPARSLLANDPFTSTSRPAHFHFCRTNLFPLSQQRPTGPKEEIARWHHYSDLPTSHLLH